MDHPCPFSKPILRVIEDYLASIPSTHVHDPCAGNGDRLAALCASSGHSFSGTEIQPNFIKHPSVKQGDSTMQNTYPVPGYILCTSIVYPNGMADDHESTDASERHTYRAANGGPLEENNMGKFGYRNTLRGGRSKKRAQYWDLARRMVDNWDGASVLIVNVSDFKYTRNGVVHTEPVTDDWKNLLRDHGWLCTEFNVPTQRQRHGANGQTRVDHESILFCVSQVTDIGVAIFPQAA